jgi:hypothetical protein
MKRSWTLAVLLLAALVVGMVLLVARVQRAIPRLSEREVRESVIATLGREADTSFVVTGYLDLVVTTRSEDTRVLLPSILDLSLGTTRATVRVPGRVSYGFDLSLLDPESIRLIGDTVELEVPPLSVYSAEPDLARLQVETSTGWMRHPVTARDAERRAVQHLTRALRARGEAHLAEAMQPRVHTAGTLERLLAPTLRARGIAEPHVRIRIGDDLVLVPGPAP